MKNTEFKSIVKKAYNKNNYAKEYRQRGLIEFEKIIFNETISLLKTDATVLDLGCGSGYPYDKYFSDKGFELTGVDFSEKQIELAKRYNPSAEYIVGDISTFKTNRQFDLVLALFSILHIPRNEHEAIFRKVYDLLNENGLLLLTISDKPQGELIERGFVGDTMLWSYFDYAIYVALLEGIGFQIEFSKNQRDYGIEPHNWILLRK